jgi:hypothetical protein
LTAILTATESKSAQSATLGTLARSVWNVKENSQTSYHAIVVISFNSRGCSFRSLALVAMCVFLLPPSLAAQTPVHPRVLILVDTSSEMAKHLVDNCSTGGDGSSGFIDTSVNLPTLYHGLPGPVDPSACLVPCTSTTFDGINSRLYAAKTAVTNVFTATSPKIDWGLMRYSGATCTVAANPFQAHTCTQNSNCASNNCVSGVCRGTTNFDCSPGEVLNNGVCGTDANLCRAASGSIYQEANCTTTRSLPITYTGGCGTSALAGSPSCATPQSCNSDADCNGGAAGSCVALTGFAARACKGGIGFTCPAGYAASNGFCRYNLGCQSAGGVVLADPASASSTSAALPYVDGVENYTPNASSQPTNPELRADGPTPLAGSIRTATQW